MSKAEIARRTSLLFKSIDLLKNCVLDSKDSTVLVSKSELGGAILRSLNEFNVRSIFGEAIYGAGLQSFLQGRVLEKRFSNDTLSGKVDERGRKWSSDAQFFEPTITLERRNNAKKIHTYGYCACNFAKEGSLCPHMAALMVMWIRKREDFEERTSEKDVETAKTRVMDSIRDLADLIRKEPSSRATDLEVLQKTYSKLKLWTDETKEAGSTNKNQRTLGFSSIINYITFTLMSTIESKYEISAINLYNKNTVSTFGRVLDLLAEKNLKRRSKAHQERKIRSKGVSSRTTRSWDKLIENFADQQ